MTDIEAPSPSGQGAPAQQPTAPAASAGSDATAPPAQTSDASQPAAAAVSSRAAAFARRLALLLLSGGADSLRRLAALTARLLLRLGAAVRCGAPSAAALAARALARLAALLRPVSRPLGALLSRLVSLQLRLTANEDEGDAVAGQLASLRLHSCLALLFGAVRLRSHTCLQLGMPSRHHPLPSLASPRPVSASAEAASSVGDRPAKQQAEAQAPPRPGGGGADAEVHVLCSAELRAAILSFLQHASSTTGEEWVLLRNTMAGGGNAAAQQQQQQQQDAAAGAGTQEGACSTTQPRTLAHVLAGAGGLRSSGSGSAVATWGQALVAAGLTQSWPGPGTAAAPAPAVASPSSLGRSPNCVAASGASGLARRASMGDDPSTAPSAPLLLGGDALVGVSVGQPQHGGASPTAGAKAWQQQAAAARGGASFAADAAADASLTSLAALCRNQRASSSGGATSQAAVEVAAHPLCDGDHSEQQQDTALSAGGGVPDCVPSSPRRCASPAGLAARQAQAGGSPVAAKKKLPAAPLLAPPGALAASDTAGQA